MEYVTLYNGVKVPALGIGTFMISPEDTEKAVYAALKGGYRMIDTANAYMNEEAVGKALARRLRRSRDTEEVLCPRAPGRRFIQTSRLWRTL